MAVFNGNKNVEFFNQAEVAEKYDWKWNLRNLDDINLEKIRQRDEAIGDEWDMSKPLMVVNKNTNQGVRGYIRSQVIAGYSEEKFAKIFPKGVPIRVLELTDDEAAEKMLDHGDSHGLEAGEIGQTAINLYKSGYTEVEVRRRMDVLFSQLLKPSTRDALMKRIREEKNPEKRDGIYSAGLRNVSLKFARLYKLPERVFTAWVRGTKNEGPQISDGTIQALEKICSKNPKHTKSVPCEKFLTAWETVKKGKTKAKKQGWTAADAKNQTANYSSSLARDIFGKFCGNEVDMSTSLELDSLLSRLEWLRENDPDSFVKIEGIIESKFQPDTE